MIAVKLQQLRGFVTLKNECEHKMAAERLTQIELESVQLHETKPRSLARDLQNESITQEDDIDTAMGPLHCMVQGNRSKPAIFTYHDIGLHSISNFQGFFNFSEMQPILKHFCVYHITAPGQQENAPPLPYGVIDTSGLKQSESAHLLNQNTTPVPPEVLKRASYQFPTMEQLSEMLGPVMQFYGVRSFIGFGMGAGANVLSRFALNHPEKVDGLVLINACAGKSTWTEWGYQKSNCWYLRSGQMTQGIQEYLLWHWFGGQTMRSNHDLVSAFADNINGINPQNLAHFIDSYIRRDDLGIERNLDVTRKDEICNFKCPVMLVSGDFAPHLNETIWMNGRLDPANSTWMKFECGGMVLEEVPHKLCESFLLFIQGMGYIPGYRPVNSCAASSKRSNAMLLESDASGSSLGAAGDHPPGKQHAATASSTQVC